MRAFTERHPRFDGRCSIVAPQSTVAHPESTAEGVGTLPLDLFLMCAGVQARDALERALGL